MIMSHSKIRELYQEEGPTITANKDKWISSEADKVSGRQFRNSFDWALSMHCMAVSCC